MPAKPLGLLALGAALLLPACTTMAPTSPASVTRYHAPDLLARSSGGTVFVETAPGVEMDAEEAAAFKSAVAYELTRLGYQETSRDQAASIAQVRVERYLDNEGMARRSPVSVGVGGSTGSYGSGMGMGIGINLGGGPRETVGTELGVMLRDKASEATYWEGRAQFSVDEKAPLAESRANASALAGALFGEFPGNNGETVEVRVE